MLASDANAVKSGTEKVDGEVDDKSGAAVAGNGTAQAVNPLTMPRATTSFFDGGSAMEAVLAYLRVEMVFNPDPPSAKALLKRMQAIVRDALATSFCGLFVTLRCWLCLLLC